MTNLNLPPEIVAKVQAALEKSSLCMACVDGGYLLYRWDSTRNRNGGLVHSFWTAESFIDWCLSIEAQGYKIGYEKW